MGLAGIGDDLEEIEQNFQNSRVRVRTKSYLKEQMSFIEKMFEKSSVSLGPFQRNHS